MTNKNIKNRRIEIRLTDRDYFIISSKAKDNKQSISEYLRNLGLSDIDSNTTRDQKLIRLIMILNNEVNMAKIENRQIDSNKISALTVDIYKVVNRTRKQKKEFERSDTKTYI